MGNHLNIVIVDDELIGRKTLGALLNNQGYNLAFVGSGPELFTKISELNPDVILLDVMMPDMDGFEVCQRLKADMQWQHIPIILITALETKSDMLRGFEARADDFLSKPVDKLELRARVRSMLRIKSQHDQLAEKQKELTMTLNFNQQASQIIAHYTGHLEMQNDLSLSLLTTTESEMALNLVTQATEEIIPEATGCIMHFASTDKRHVSFSDNPAVKAELPDIGLVDEIVKEAVISREVTYIADLSKHSSSIQPQPSYGSAWLIAPAAKNPSSLLAYSLYSTEAQVFTENDRYLLSILTNQLVAALTMIGSLINGQIDLEHETPFITDSPLPICDDACKDNQA